MVFIDLTLLASQIAEFEGVFGAFRFCHEDRYVEKLKPRLALLLGMFVHSSIYTTYGRSCY